MSVLILLGQASPCRLGGLGSGVFGSLDRTPFVACWMVAVKMENNVGVSFLTVDGFFEVRRR